MKRKIKVLIVLAINLSVADHFLTMNKTSFRLLILRWNLMKTPTYITKHS